ncbi:MAG: TatD family hydrolase [Planctomycetota bacterium]
MIDTHCHLSSTDFDTDLPAILERALSAGVEKFVTIATGPGDWERCLKIADAHAHIRVALGIHPNEASCFSAEIFNTMSALARNPHVIGIGETGLDFFRDHAPRDKQADAFQAQLDLSEELNKPFILHCRAAEKEMLEVLEKHRVKTGRDLNGVWHCFTATKEFGLRAAEMGLYFGLGGVMTYPKAIDVRDAIAALPEDRLVLETDCPYLPPQPWRGKRNEPSFLTATVQKLAEVRSTTPEAARAFTTANANRLFAQ